MSAAFDPVPGWETAVLGGTLLRNSHYAQCTALGLLPEHFTQALHGELWAAIGETIEQDIVANPLSLGGRFADHPALRGDNPVRRIGQLAIAAAGIVNVADYARLLLEEAQRNRVGKLGNDLRFASADRSNDLARVIDQTQAELDRYRPASAQPPMISLLEAVREAQANVRRVIEQGAVDGVPFGLAALDLLLGGAVKSDLVVMAGRPGMGKTALGWHVALHNARAGKRVAFITLEMTAAQLAARAIAQVIEVSAHKLRHGDLNAAEQAAVAAADAELDLPIFLSRIGAADPGQVRQRVKELIQRLGDIDLVVIDYLQLMDSTGYADNRVQEIAAITRALKALAVELNLPVIALSQLNRGTEGREDKRPLLSDLRDSGAIEQDADTVILVYREEYYVARQEPRDPDSPERQHWSERLQKCMGQADLIVAKSRHGPSGTVTVGFAPALTRFYDLPNPVMR